jgi:hypothetical protein
MGFTRTCWVSFGVVSLTGWSIIACGGADGGSPASVNVTGGLEIESLSHNCATTLFGLTGSPYNATTAANLVKTACTNNMEGGTCQISNQIVQQCVAGFPASVGTSTMDLTLINGANPPTNCGGGQLLSKDYAVFAIVASTGSGGDGGGGGDGGHGADGGAGCSGAVAQWALQPACQQSNVQVFSWTDSTTGKEKCVAVADPPPLS